MTTPQSVHVELAGIRLSVRTDASKEHVQRIVKDVERRLKTINEQAQSAPLNRRLILVALTLGEDLMQEQSGAQHAQEQAKTLGDDLSQNVAELERKSRELNLLQQKYESLSKSNESLKSQIEERDAATAELNAELAELQKNHTATLERAELAERHAEQSDEALREVKTQLEETLNERTNLSQATAASTATQAKLEGKLRTQDSTIDELQTYRRDVASRAQTALKLVEESNLIPTP